MNDAQQVTVSIPVNDYRRVQVYAFPSANEYFGIE
jgi:hypothetical protein